MASKTEPKTSSTGTGTPGSPETNKALATTGGSALPAFMQDDAGTGKENIDQSDLIIPRVALMQAINPEVVEGKASSGDFWHTINEMTLGTTLKVVVVHHSKRYTMWRPRHAGGGIIARASDGVHWDADFKDSFAPYKDRPKHLVEYAAKKGDIVSKDVGLGRWGTLDPENEDSAPAATLSHVMVCVALDYPELGPFVVYLQRSAEPVGKALLTKIKLDKAPIFGQVYDVGSKVVQGDSGDYNQYTFTKAGHVDTEELYVEFKAMNQSFTEMGVKTNEEAPEDTTGGDKGGAAAPDGKDDKY